MPFRAYHDRTGERYGRLLIVGYEGTKNHSRVWKCKCDCGKTVCVSWKSIQQNHRTSCGCRQEETRKSYGGRAGANRKPVGESAFNQLIFNYKKSARERGYIFDLTDDHFRYLTKQPCYYCGQIADRPSPIAKGTNGDYLYNGIDRIDNSKGYVNGNVRTCCKQCNIAKNVISEPEFIEWVKRVASRFEHGEHP